MGYGTRSNRVRMDSIDTLTFYSNEQTAYRRSSPVDSLTCIGKPCMIYQPDVVQCTKQGGRGNDIQWKCQADLPSSMRFGRVEVSCEGYDNPQDEYILKGSCGLTYHLVPANPKLEDPNYIPSRNRTGEFASKFISNLFNFITLSIILYILYSVILRPLLRYFSNNAPLVPGQAGDTGRPPRPWFGGFGPGGGGGGGPPRAGGRPPSDFRDEKPSSTMESEGASASINAGFRPGFWTGLAGGALGAAATNHLLNRGNDQPQQRRYAATAPPQGGRGFFSGGGGGDGRDWDRGEGPSGSSGMGSMRSSSGFGGTRNR